MDKLDFEEGLYTSYRVAEDEILLIRVADAPREEMVTTDAILSSGTWVAVALEEFGDTLLERYKRFGA